MTPLFAIIGAGVALGAAGSGHCAVMCGPLVVLAQPQRSGGGQVAGHVAAYHGGRLLSYALLGALVGATGGWIAANGFGRALAIAAAATLVVQAFLQWRFRSALSWPLLTRAIGAAGRLMRRHTIAGPAVFGALTGLLPCGLVYAALTASLGLGGAASGVAFMLAFGLGSIPMLAVIGLSARTLRTGASAHMFKRLAPAGLAIVALLLVMRASSMHTGHHGAVPAPALAPAAHAHR